MASGVQAPAPSSRGSYGQIGDASDVDRCVFLARKAVDRSSSGAKSERRQRAGRHRWRSQRPRLRGAESTAAVTRGAWFIREQANDAVSHWRPRRVPIPSRISAPRERCIDDAPRGHSTRCRSPLWSLQAWVAAATTHAWCPRSRCIAMRARGFAAGAPMRSRRQHGQKAPVGQAVRLPPASTGALREHAAGPSPRDAGAAECAHRPILVARYKKPRSMAGFQGTSAVRSNA
jgi:hypothetical protein